MSSSKDLIIIDPKIDTDIVIFDLSFLFDFLFYFETPIQTTISL